MNCDQNSRSTFIAWSTNSFMWYLYHNFAYLGIGINHAAAQSIKEVDTNSRGYYWREDLQECAHSSCMNIACLAAHQKPSMNWAHGGTLDRRLHCNLSFPGGSSGSLSVNGELSAATFSITSRSVMVFGQIKLPSTEHSHHISLLPNKTCWIPFAFLHAISHAKLAYGHVISSHVLDY